MTKYGWIVVVAMIAIFGRSNAWAAECFNVAKGEPRSLTGKLVYAIFPGPPEFEDVQKGDTPEPTYVLQLSSAICITGDEFADANKWFRAVQLVETDATSDKLRKFLNMMVVVTLTDQMAANTGHHHEPLVAWVSSIQEAGAHPMEFTDEYGTAATTIRAFYEALRDGQGEIASSLIAPEKRAISAFTPEALTSFYGSLAEPIQMLDIAQSDENTFVVHYRYRIASRGCDGRAVVRTAVRAGRNFIIGIKALNGC